MEPRSAAESAHGTPALLSELNGTPTQIKFQHWFNASHPSRLSKFSGGNPEFGIKLSDCTLTNITALAVLVTWQASIGCVMASNHSSIVIDDRIQVVDGRLLHLILLADTELTQIQIPTTQHYIRGFTMEMGKQSAQSFIIKNLFCMWKTQHLFTLKWVKISGACRSISGGGLLFTVHLPDRKVHHVIDFIPPDETPKGEAFQLDDQNIGQTPQQQLFRGLSVLLALWTVP